MPCLFNCSELHSRISSSIEIKTFHFEAIKSVGWNGVQSRRKVHPASLFASKSRPERDVFFPTHRVLGVRYVLTGADRLCWELTSVLYNAAMTSHICHALLWTRGEVECVSQVLRGSRNFPAPLCASVLVESEKHDRRTELQLRLIGNAAQERTLVLGGVRIKWRVSSSSHNIINNSNALHPKCCLFVKRASLYSAA